MIAAASIRDDEQEQPAPRTELDEAIERLDRLRKAMKAKKREKRMPQRFYWQDKD
jgi:hypothetical protein